MSVVELNSGHDIVKDTGYPDRAATVPSTEGTRETTTEKATENGEIKEADKNDTLEHVAAAEKDQNDDKKAGVGSDTNNKGSEQGEKETVADDNEFQDDIGAGEEDEDDQEDSSSVSPDGKKHVVFSRGTGNLGDLMFQYATVSSIARSSKRRPTFSLAFSPLLTLFPDAPIVIIDDEEIEELEPLVNVTLSESQVTMDSVRHDIPEGPSVEIVGQVNSWKYFHVIMDRLQKDITPGDFYTEAADEYLEEVISRVMKENRKQDGKETTDNDINKKDEINEKKYDKNGFLKYDYDKDVDKESHVNVPAIPETTTLRSMVAELRQTEDITLVGMYVSAEMSEDPDSEDDMEEVQDANKTKQPKEKAAKFIKYIKNAMDYYRAEHGTRDHVQFVFVCEHLPWCLRHLNGPGVHFAIGGSPELDLTILARCDHAILTPSSLSWWSAWLTGGQVVYSDKMDKIAGLSRDDYVMPEWTPIGDDQASYYGYY